QVAIFSRPCTWSARAIRHRHASLHRSRSVLRIVQVLPRGAEAGGIIPRRRSVVGRRGVILWRGIVSCRRSVVIGSRRRCAHGRTRDNAGRRSSGNGAAAPAPAVARAPAPAAIVAAIATPAASVVAAVATPAAGAAIPAGSAIPIDRASRSRGARAPSARVTVRSDVAIAERAIRRGSGVIAVGAAVAARAHMADGIGPVRRVAVSAAVAVRPHMAVGERPVPRGSATVAIDAAVAARPYMAVGEGPVPPGSATVAVGAAVAAGSVLFGDAAAPGSEPPAAAVPSMGRLRRRKAGGDDRSGEKRRAQPHGSLLYRQSPVACRRVLRRSW